ncbi:transporter substrate-binding domain-containing protein [Funiculus sociatus GB2-A5]|uniref:Transporter substrate-binding domain-containing protein n=2 Tax=Cyanobacteriota TaxID=1117 RepID=A0ABV0JPM9_9CYAN|nr:MULTISPECIES: transporter substrate-binding domain-containing protein [unclassified Trichocoleus]MBD1906547.1 transporter substrate-binding domain-containing protein [Trichocoleus sp. FACHB-832]MBD2063051.1 transporter substrate-binding domain-containing protein [Trichocoleus sp. FACHB-6]
MKDKLILPIAFCLFSFSLCLLPPPTFSDSRAGEIRKIYWWVVGSIAFSHAAELKEIQERGYLMVAVKDNLRPLGFTDASGKLQGLEIDLARRLAAEILGKPDAVRLQPVANRDRISVVLEGKVDLTIARVTATSSRDRLVNFSLPYYLDGTALVTKDASLQKLDDVQNQKIAVLKGSDTISQVRFIIPQVELVGVDSYEEARSLLESGGASAFAADASVLTGWVQEYPQYRLLSVRLSGLPLAVVMPKGLQYDSLRQRVNDAIARWKAEGWLQERIKYWGLPQSDTPRFQTR